MPLRWLPIEKRTPRMRKLPDGAPPPWYGWISPSLGAAGFVLSVLSLSIALSNYRLSRMSHLENTAPKLMVSQIQLSHPRGKAGDIPVVSYQVLNRGALTLYDVHSQINWTYQHAPVDPSKPAVVAGSNNEGVETGPTVIPNDWLDKTFPLFGGALVGDTPSYAALHDGLAVLTVNVATQSNDTTGTRILTCDHFEYQWLIDRFERRGFCIPNDVVRQFREPSLPGRMTIGPTPIDSRIRQ
jgi:hypothetical protein